MLIVNDCIITPTIFPDKTSQIWKLPAACLASGPKRIVWEFENEAEVFHLMQLHALLKQCSEGTIDLHMPYLPYGRQDKPVANDSCFALLVFNNILETLKFNSVTTIDAHSSVANHVISMYPEGQIASAINDFHPAQICFPDHGASERYTSLAGLFNDIILDKDRDPLTGRILGLKVSKCPPFITRVLIIDDICDGGRTFIEAAKLLQTINPNVILGLYVSHGIFSKGIDVLRDAGIKSIYTKNGVVK